MKSITLLAGAVALALPTVSTANDYLNADFVQAYVQDFEDTNPIGVGGRFAVTPNGKIIGDFVYSSFDVSVPGGSSKTDSLTARLGYRHTVAPFANGAGVFGVGGGLTYLNASTTVEVEFFEFSETTEISATETDFYLEADMEYAVGQSSVVHAVLNFQDSDVNIGGGFSYYLAPQFGVRLEGVIDGAIQVGVAIKF